MSNTIHTVLLGHGQRVTLAVYVRAWKTALAAPADAWFPRTPCSWAGGDRAQVLHEFRAGIDDRINRHLPDYGTGRKWRSEWQVETRRAAQALNTPRLAIHWLPQWLKGRFAGRIATYGD